VWCGIFGKSAAEWIPQKWGKWLEQGKPWIFRSSSAFILSTPYPTSSPYAPLYSENKQSGLVWNGELYPVQSQSTERLWEIYKTKGPEGFGDLNGAFAVAIWDAQEEKGILASDHLGILPVYYGEAGGRLAFANIPELVLLLLKKSPELNSSALFKYLAFCYNPGWETFFKGIYRLRPGHFLEFSKGRPTLRPYWPLSFLPRAGSETDFVNELRERLIESIHIRQEPETRVGVFLSGGLDSSTVTALLSREKNAVSTFSFRCQGETFDESHYAEMVAKTFGTSHTLVEYRPEDIESVEDWVVHMDEPFCDAGINVATFLLAKSASGHIDVVFTGDGGDELFGGHPVYVADRVDQSLRKIPKWIRHPVFTLGKLLPDSNKKKDWKVKLKRFSASQRFPLALGTYRWRVYYLPNELEKLLMPDCWDSHLGNRVYEDIFQLYQEASAFTDLGRTLYADYWTVVHFYLRRMGLVRPFGIRPKFPLLDPRLVEFCAAIPESYKIRGLSDVKYIERKAVEAFLPYEIVYRKDKLGHSIPLKNWIRHHPKVRSFFYDMLSPSRIRNQGLFRPESVQRMLSEHVEARENHSHRLWALIVLECWLKKRWEAFSGSDFILKMDTGKL